MSDPHLELMAYQQEAVTKSLAFLEKSKGFYNASDMGTGKSIMTLECLSKLDVEKILIVCPKIVKLVWQIEIKKWYKGEAEFTIINYEETRNPEKLKQLILRKFDVMVMDESHKLKNRKAQVTKAVLGDLWDSVKYRICLSGTPMTQGIPDLFTLYSRFLPEAFSNYYEFANTFSHQKQTPWGTSYFGVKNAELLKKLSTCNFLFRYKRDDVLTQLPDKVFTKVPLSAEYAVKETPEEKSAHENWVRQVQIALSSGQKVRAAPPKSIQTLLLEQGLKKIPRIKELVEEFASQQIKSVIFCVHQKVVEQLGISLKEFRPSIIYGPTSQTDRELAIDNFQNGDSLVAILSYGAASLGITLTASHIVVLGEYSYSPAEVMQGISRCDRIGQKNNVQIFYPVVEGSVDTDCIDILMRKVKDFSTLFNE